LSFLSQQHLISSLEIVKKNQNDLNGLKRQFPNFISLYQAFSNFSDEDFRNSNGNIKPFEDYVTIVMREGEKYFEPVVSGFLMSQLVNKSGIVFVGEEVYKFKYENLYIFDKKHFPEFINGNIPVEKIPNVKITPIVRSIITVTDKQLTPRWNVDWCESMYVPNKRKMNGVISTTQLLYWTDIDATTKHLVKGFLGIWGGVSEKRLSQMGFVAALTFPSGIPIPGVVSIDGECFECDKITVGQGLGGHWEITNYTTEHRLEFRGGTPPRTCSLFR
jgi:hypothetical protein